MWSQEQAIQESSFQDSLAACQHWGWIVGCCIWLDISPLVWRDSSLLPFADPAKCRKKSEGRGNSNRSLPGKGEGLQELMGGWATGTCLGGGGCSTGAFLGRKRRAECEVWAIDAAEDELFWADYNSNFGPQTSLMVTPAHLTFASIVRWAVWPRFYYIVTSLCNWSIYIDLQESPNHSPTLRVAVSLGNWWGVSFNYFLNIGMCEILSFVPVRH